VEAVRANPEGTLHLMHGLALLQKAEWAQAEAAFLQASRSPALFPVRRVALFYAIRCQGQQLHNSGYKDEEARKRLGPPLREIVGMGPVRIAWADPLAGLAIQVRDLVTARSILDQWQAKEPAKPAVLFRRMELEYLTEAYGPAIRAAEQLLAQDPKHKNARWILDQSRRKSRELGAEKGALLLW
jgi:hypothetical protein